MTKKMDQLIGALLLDFQIDGNSLNLKFDAARRLVIHNSWKIYDAEGRETNGAAVVSKAVTNIQSSGTKFCLEFDQFELIVDLSASAWTGPEAAVLYENSRPLMAWT